MRTLFAVTRTSGLRARTHSAVTRTSGLRTRTHFAVTRTSRSRTRTLSAVTRTFGLRTRTHIAVTRTSGLRTRTHSGAISHWKSQVCIAAPSSLHTLYSQGCSKGILFVSILFTRACIFIYSFFLHSLVAVICSRFVCVLSDKLSVIPLTVCQKNLHSTMVTSYSLTDELYAKDLCINRLNPRCRQ